MLDSNDLLAVSDSVKSTQYTSQSSGVLEEARVLFKKLFEGSDYLVTDRFEAIGFSVFMYTNSNGTEYYMIGEKDSNKNGLGLFLIKKNITNKQPIFIHAPHQFADLNTGHILRLWVDKNDIDACFWNTANRSYADHSDLEESLLISATRAFIDRFDKGRIVQVHGYSKGVRSTSEGQNSDIILSNGTEEYDLDILTVRDFLTNVLVDQQVSLFGRDVTELGATTNTVGIEKRLYTSGQFMHLELSSETRTAWVAGISTEKNIVRSLNQRITE